MKDLVSKYTIQADNNLLDFLNEDYFEERRKVFFKVTSEFKKEDVNWALGCSSNLFFRGIVDDFNDFDFIIASESIEKVEKIMESLGARLIATGGNGFCESDIYLHYSINNVDIDIISGFRLQTFGTSYYYQYNSAEIENLETDYMEIPMLSAEALFLLYAMMEGWQRRRRFKRELLFTYLKTCSIRYPQVLRKSVKSFNLPGWILELILELL